MLSSGTPDPISLRMNCLISTVFPLRLIPVMIFTTSVLSLPDSSLSRYGRLMISGIIVRKLF